MGRWRKDALEACRSAEHWVLLALTQITRQPITHVMFWMQAQASKQSEQRKAVFEHSEQSRS
eukprot:6327692-Alexandrium_andersonii.AAC.1